MLSKILIKKKQELDIFLSYYFKKNGAVTENSTLKSEPLFTSATTGTLVLEFDLIYFNACIGIHDNVRDKLELNFKIDSQNQKLKLIVPSLPEREMDEI